MMQWLMFRGAAGGFRDRHWSAGERALFHRAHSAAAGLGADAMEGEGTAEVGRRGDTGEVVVRIDPRYWPGSRDPSW